MKGGRGFAVGGLTGVVGQEGGMEDSEGGGGVIAPSFGSDCETDCESSGGDKQR